MIGNIPLPKSCNAVIWTLNPANTSLRNFDENDLTVCPSTTVHRLTPIPSSIAPIRRDVIEPANPRHKHPKAQHDAVTEIGIHGPYLSNDHPLTGPPINAPILIMKPKCPISIVVAPIAR